MAAQLLLLKNEDILLANPRLGSYKINAIIKIPNFKLKTKEELMPIFQKDYYLNGIKDIKTEILISACKLNIKILDSRGNNRGNGWGKNETRGGKPYYPPLDWYGYGLNVYGRFDNGNNIWLDYRPINGVWCVGFFGAGKKN